MLKPRNSSDRTSVGVLCQLPGWPLTSTLRWAPVLHTSCIEGSSKSTDPHLSLNFRTEGALATVGDSNHHGVPYTSYTSHDEFFFTEERRRCICWDRTLNQWNTANVSYKYFFSAFWTFHFHLDISGWGMPYFFWSINSLCWHVPYFRK